MNTLRPYQQAAVNAFNHAKTGRNLIVLPTGSGKTHVIAAICETNPLKRVLVISHVKEILQQNAEKLRQYVSPGLVGIYSAGLKSRQLLQYCVASIQTIYKRADLFADYDIIIVDEAHALPPNGEGRYRTLFQELTNRPILGLTATPFRMQSGYLVDSGLFDRIIYSADMLELIEQGFLSDLSTKQTNYIMNLNDVKIVAGDYSKKDLLSKFDNANTTNTIIDEIVTKYRDRKSWLIFAIDIAHAEHINRKLLESKVASYAIHSKMKNDRSPYIELFKQGVLQALVSVETLTTGFDAPGIDLIVLLRPTQSPGLHVQMVGRGLRPAPGKEDGCLILDFAGNTARLGPINVPYVKPKGQSKSTNPLPLTKTCPECQEILPIQATKCKQCGHVFHAKTNLKTKASDVPIITKIFIKTYKVNSIRYFKHIKKNSPPSLKVQYFCGETNIFNEWVCLEHFGYPKLRAGAWWRYRTGRKEVPVNVNDAIKQFYLLKEVDTITVSTKGLYPEIIGVTFNESTRQES